MTNRDMMKRRGGVPVRAFRRFCVTLSRMKPETRRTMLPGEDAMSERAVQFALGRRSLGVHEVYLWWAGRKYDEFMDTLERKLK